MYLTNSFSPSLAWKTSCRVLPSSSGRRSVRVMVMPALRYASSRMRLAMMSYLNSVVAVKMAGSGQNCWRVPLCSVSPTILTG